MGENYDQPNISMRPYSFDLINGCHYFSNSAKEQSEVKFIRYNNAACVIFAASLIEAMVNEYISLSHTMGIGDKYAPQEYWEALSNAKKNINLKDKWNLYVSMRGGTIWDSSKEPFQSYDLIIALRNELVHFKADFLEHTAAPVKKLLPLIEKFYTNDPEVLSDDSDDWITKILESKTLGGWIVEKVDYGTIMDHLSHKS